MPAAAKTCSGGGALLAIGLCQINLLSRPKDSALAGFHIAETVHSREAS
jgi:hypothetical protein